MGKKHIKNLTINISRQLNRERTQNKLELEQSISQLQSNLMYDEERLKMLQNKLRDIHISESQGARVRSRVTWWEEGETSSRYFHNLEKKKW